MVKAVKAKSRITTSFQTLLKYFRDKKFKKKRIRNNKCEGSDTAGLECKHDYFQIKLNKMPLHICQVAKL